MNRSLHVTAPLRRLEPAASRRIDPCALSRCRDRYIEAVGETLSIPRHISRVDCAKARGWQVRFTKPSSFFSDASHGDDPLASLRAAKRELRRIWRPEPQCTGRLPNGGVRLIRNGRGQWYVEATHPRGKSPRRFYVGTDATRTMRRQAEARRNARAQRADWLQSIKVPTR